MLVLKKLALSGVMSAALLFLSAANAQTIYNPFAQNYTAPSAQNQYQYQITSHNQSMVPVNRLIPPHNFAVGRPNLSCVVQAAQRRNIPVDIMLGVQSVERGETGRQMRNSNATYDLGAFQINTIHLPRIARLGGSRDDVLSRGCFNAEVASLLLYEALTHPKKQHEDLFTRAAGYHSWTPKHNRNYRAKLINYTRQWQAWMRANNMSSLIGAPI